MSRAQTLAAALCLSLTAAGCDPIMSDEPSPASGPDAPGGKGDAIDDEPTVEGLVAGYLELDGGPTLEQLLSTSAEYTATPEYFIDDVPRGNFCARVPITGDAPAPGYNTDNAETLAWMAANEYAHYVRFARLLERSGWASPEDVRTWELRAAAIQIGKIGHAWRVSVRGTQMQNLGGDRAWFQAILDAPEFTLEWLDEVPIDLLTTLEQNEAQLGARDPAGLEQRWLQEPEVGRRLQFFTAGRYVVGGNGPEFKQESTQFAWIQHPTRDLAVIVFRGTQPQGGDGDIWTDLNGFKEPVSLDDGRDYHIHRGFLGALRDVEDMLRDKLALDGTDQRLWVTGHSLGGSLASLTAGAILFWQARGDREVREVELGGTYTFGAARVGDLDFAEAMEWAAQDEEIPLLRFRNADDPVTKVAPQEFGLIDFAHAGQMVLLNPTGVEVSKVPALELADTIAFSSTPDPGNDMTPDHFLPEYQAKVGSEWITGYTDDQRPSQLRKFSPGRAIDIELSVLGCIGNVGRCLQMHAMGPNDGSTYYAQLLRQTEQQPWTKCADAQ